MKLSEVIRKNSSLSDDDMADAMERLDLIKDIANERSDKEFEIDTDKKKNVINLITVGDVDGYPSISVNRNMVWDRDEAVPHFFVFRQATDTLQSIAKHFTELKEAIKYFLELLKDTK